MSHNTHFKLYIFTRPSVNDVRAQVSTNKKSCDIGSKMKGHADFKVDI